MFCMKLLLILFCLITAINEYEMILNKCEHEVCKIGSNKFHYDCLKTCVQAMKNRLNLHRGFAGPEILAKMLKRKH